MGLPRRRPRPIRCHLCWRHTDIRRHCGSHMCAWIVCDICGATSGNLMLARKPILAWFRVKPQVS